LRVPDDVILSLALHVLARAQIVAFGGVYAAWLLECLDPDAAAVAWAELRDTPEAFRACFGCRMSSGMTTARYLDEYAPPLRELWNGPVRGPRPW
jgi:hypothetical protein